MSNSTDTRSNRLSAARRQSPEAAAAIAELRGTIAGEIRDDPLSRTLYATDASIYQMFPDAVVLPRSAADVAAAVRTCVKHGVPLTARGAGTGLTGGAVNRGLQLDCSRFLNRILHVDAEHRTVRVEPGVVLDELNAELKQHGLQFAPDVATSNRATIGGMIANNSCGARSVRYGRTVDHVLHVDVVLGDGSVATWGRDVRPPTNRRARQCEETLAAVARECAADIAARFPKVLRSNGGYALDRVRIDDSAAASATNEAGVPLLDTHAKRLTHVNAETVICGSEGTLAVIVGAKLNLVPLPKCKGLLIVQFDAVMPALEAVSPILEHKPAAVELIDDLILQASKRNQNMLRRRWWVEDDPQAILICEMFADDDATLIRRLNDLEADLKKRTAATAFRQIPEVAGQADVWEVRKSGLGLLMSRPGQAQPYAFIEDTAVDPARLPEYIRRMDAILAEEGVTQTGHYAHASVGCLHVRPVLNLRRREEIDRMRRIGDRVTSLAVEFGGTINGEHGDGLACSVWLEKLYGPRIVAAFKKVKQAFDPHGILNPGKIVDPLPMHENLRYGEGYASQEPETLLDFSTHGGMAGLADMCTGVGLCRQRLAGAMCPSYMATSDETHTTRARANALRVALSDRGFLDGLADPVLDEVMDLCLSCKACKTECPTGVDLARLKAEWLHHRHQRRGVPRRSRLVADLPGLAAWGSRLVPVSNWLAQSSWVRAFVEFWYGLDRRVPPPRFVRPTFRRWFAKHARQRGKSATSPRQVVYFVDTWTNYYTPQVGIAAVSVLERLGFDVIVPRTKCCGRPAISKGLLDKAKRLAERNIGVLAGYAAQSLPIIGTEPSCILTLVDEYPQLVRTAEARQVAATARTMETFVAEVLRERPDAIASQAGARALLYHGHCHQKALTGTADAMAVLAACAGSRVSEIPSGCCGMAGSFGHEHEHYDVARAVGEQRLFPAIRARGDAAVVVSGFSCRQHIEHHTGVAARHVVEFLADAIGPFSSP